MQQGNLTQDSLFVVISFKDGDGDLGTDSDGVLKNISLIDSRTGDEYGSFKVPPLDIGGSKTGVEGEITMKLYTTCCLFTSITPCTPTPDFPRDSLSLTIQMIDDSGKESNIITTPQFFLNCQ